MRINLLASLRTYILTRIVKTFARCWLVTTTYGQVYGFTTHTRDIVFEGITYQSINGFQATDIRTSDGLATDSFSVQTFLSAASEQLISAGVFDNAYVEMFTVNYMDLTMGKLVEKTGTLGEIPRSDGAGDFELRGITQILDTKIGRTFNILCDADLGDDRCGVNVFPVEFAVDVVVTAAPTNTLTRSDGGSFLDNGYVVGGILTISGSGLANNLTANITAVTATVITVDEDLVAETETLVLYQANPFYALGSVVGVVEARRSFTIDTSSADDFFTRGTLTFLTGTNAGFSRDIRVQRGVLITTLLPFPYDIDVADTFEMTAGCLKDMNTCITKFNNLSKFRGTPYVPVDEDVFSSPIVSPNTVE